MFRGPAGISSLLKEGNRSFSGKEEALYRSIDGSKKLRDLVKTSFGPTGMSKLITNFLNKRFLTSDASTIMTELEVVNPAAKLVSLAVKMQNKEFGDSTNLVAILIGELLEKAERALKQGIHVSALIRSFNMCAQQVEQYFKQLPAFHFEVNPELIRSVISTKLRSPENIVPIGNLVYKALQSIMRPGVALNPDNVRIVKVSGGSLEGSFVVNGMVTSRAPVTTCTRKSNAKIIVLGGPIEIAEVETSNTVLIRNAEQLQTVNSSEERQIESVIKGYYDAGVEAIICGGSVSALALHYLNKYGMWAYSTASKFEIKRFAKSLGVPALQRRGTPMPEEIGYAVSLEVMELGSDLITVVKTKEENISSIVLRGATPTMLDECELAINDCLALACAVDKDNTFIPGGGASEYMLSSMIEKFANTLGGVEQYGGICFSQALAMIPQILAENCGHNSMIASAQLEAAYAKDPLCCFGIDASGNGDSVVRNIITKQDNDENAMFPELGFPVFDHCVTKAWAVKLAVNAATSILNIELIIMSKPAGGPKLPSRGHWDEADDREGFDMS